MSDTNQQELIDRITESINYAPKDVIINRINDVQDLDRPNNYGYTILNAACIEGRGDIVRYLVENCRVDINKKGIELCTPIMCAAMNNNPRNNKHYNIVQYLAEHGADPNIPDEENMTAYDYLNDEQVKCIRSIANQHGYA